MEETLTQPVQVLIQQKAPQTRAKKGAALKAIINNDGTPILTVTEKNKTGITLTIQADKLPKGLTAKQIRHTLYDHSKDYKTDFKPVPIGAQEEFTLTFKDPKRFTDPSKEDCLKLLVRAIAQGRAPKTHVKNRSGLIGPLKKRQHQTSGSNDISPIGHSGKRKHGEFIENTTGNQFFSVSQANDKKRRIQIYGDDNNLEKEDEISSFSEFNDLIKVKKEKVQINRICPDSKENFLFVEKVDILGPEAKGLYTKSLIRAGTFILEYSGTIIITDNIDQDKFKSDYIAKITDEYAIDSENEGSNKAKFINHSPIPNAKLIVSTKEGFGRINVVALKDILPNHQIRIDYGSQYFLQQDQKALCVNSTDNWKDTKRIYSENIEIYTCINESEFNQKYGEILQECMLIAEGKGPINSNMIPEYVLHMLDDKPMEFKKSIDQLAVDKINLSILINKSSVGKNVNLLEWTDQGYVTVLMLASFLGKTEFINFLLEKDVNWDIQNRNGLTAKDYAKLGLNKKNEYQSELISRENFWTSQDKEKKKKLNYQDKERSTSYGSQG